MKSIQLLNPDRRIGAPKDWDHDKDGLCHTLEVWDRDGFMISAWRPSEKELANLNAGKPLYLAISGRIHPVIWLAVEP